MDGCPPAITLAWVGSSSPSLISAFFARTNHKTTIGDLDAPYGELVSRAPPFRLLTRLQRAFPYQHACRRRSLRFNVRSPQYLSRLPLGLLVVPVSVRTLLAKSLCLPSTLGLDKASLWMLPSSPLFTAAPSAPLRTSFPDDSYPTIVTFWPLQTPNLGKSLPSLPPPVTQLR